LAKRASTRGTVLIAGAANIFVGAIKLAAGLMVGSSAMLAEAAHSAADTLNQAFLLTSVYRGERPADQRHPFGYGQERYFWSLLAALGLALRQVTGSPVWDGAASIAIGVLLVVVAVRLGLDSRDFLIGRAADPKELELIRDQPGQPVTSAVAQPREYLSGVELEEALAVAAGLADIHLVEPGLGISAHAGDVSVRIRSARRGDYVFGDKLRDLAEVLERNKAATTRDCPECTMSTPIAAQRCPECTAVITPGTHQPQPYTTVGS
jgi:hypothetical protein